MATKVFIQSLGCPKNLVDSEVMSGCLQGAGYHLVGVPEEADLLLVNTCGFIGPAVEEGIDAILALSEVKKARANCKLVVTGCMVQRYGADLQKELPEVDLFLGVDDVDFFHAAFFERVNINLPRLGADQVCIVNTSFFRHEHLPSMRPCRGESPTHSTAIDSPRRV